MSTEDTTSEDRAIPERPPADQCPGSGRPALYWRTRCYICGFTLSATKTGVLPWHCRGERVALVNGREVER